MRTPHKERRFHITHGSIRVGRRPCSSLSRGTSIVRPSLPSLSVRALAHDIQSNDKVVSTPTQNIRLAGSCPVRPTAPVSMRAVSRGRAHKFLGTCRPMRAPAGARRCLGVHSPRAPPLCADGTQNAPRREAATGSRARKYVRSDVRGRLTCFRPAPRRRRGSDRRAPWRAWARRRCRPGGSASRCCRRSGTSRGSLGCARSRGSRGCGPRRGG